MNKELQNLLDNYEEVIYGYAEPIIPSIHQIHLLLDYISQLGIKVKKLKEVIDKAIDFINSNPNVFYDEHLIDVETLKNNEMTDDYVGEIRFISNLLAILKEASE